MTYAPPTAEFYGCPLTLATVYWCDECGCLLALDTDNNAQLVADRFECATSLDAHGRPEHDCRCHVAADLHNAAET